MNGDGINDILIGAPDTNTGAGAAYVIYGARGGYPDGITLSASVPGFVIDGLASYSDLGYSVGGADVNADGLGDMIVGVPGDGQVIVIYGTEGGYPNGIDLSGELGYSTGFRILEAAYQDETGYAVAGLGGKQPENINFYNLFLVFFL